MSDTGDIKVLLDRWFDDGDDDALRRAYRGFADRLVAPTEAVEVLGQAALEEIRQDVLARLLAREGGRLQGTTAPVAYARTAWRRAVASALRKWGPRQRRAAEVRLHAEAFAPPDGHRLVEQMLDAARAIRIADVLSGKGRLAIILTTAPDRITDVDWSHIVSSLPPPPPARPNTALNREDASRLLYPPRGPESAKERYQRLNSFDKAYKRAVTRIREELEVKR